MDYHFRRLHAADDARAADVIIGVVGVVVVVIVMRIAIPVVPRAESDGSLRRTSALLLKHGDRIHAGDNLEDRPLLVLVFGLVAVVGRNFVEGLGALDGYRQMLARVYIYFRPTRRQG